MLLSRVVRTKMKIGSLLLDPEDQKEWKTFSPADELVWSCGHICSEQKLLTKMKNAEQKLCQGYYAIQTLLKICHICSLKPVTEKKLSQGQLPWGQKSSCKLVEQNGCHTHLCGLCVDDAESHMCSWQKAGDNMLVTESKICARRDSCPAEPSELSETVTL